jgi:hypothetical protein
MTLSVPSFLAAAISLLIPPPAETVLTVDQSVPPLELDEPDEQPAASSARAPSPISAVLRGDLTRMPLVNFPIPIAFVPKAEAKSNVRRSANRPREHHSA